MIINKIIEEKSDIQKKIIFYINNSQSIEEYFQNLRNFLENEHKFENRAELYTLLQIISKISDNHYREYDFFNKIEKMLINSKNKIQQNFTKKEIFDVFKNNKRILLFLFKEKIIDVDQYVLDTMKKKKYTKSFYFSYFSPEIHQFDSEFQLFDQDENFELNRKIGQNESYICKLIREDLIEDFIIFVNKNDLQLSMTVKPSIYETNLFLLQKEPSLIEYSAFFGSIQIFKYLYKNQSDLEKSSLWIYAVHSDNSDVIHYLDDNKILPNDQTFKECLLEAIKCHHNDVANYIINNHYDYENNDERIIFSQGIKYFNFSFFNQKFIVNHSLLFDLCKYNHIEIVEFLLSTKKFDINRKIILILCV